MIERQHGYGWKPDLPDFRDLPFSPPVPVGLLPSSVDLRETPWLPPVFDQGQIGSCTANAISAAIKFMENKEGIGLTADDIPSRLFIYYNERLMEGDPSRDGGAQIRDGIKSVHKQGVCSESAWPYDSAKLFDKPGAGPYALGAARAVSKYMRVDRGHVRNALAAGYPVVIGFTVYESFESASVANTGVMPMPEKGEGVLGGHAVLVVGYDDAKHVYIVRNSWGPHWGQAGCFLMPQPYLADRGLSSDFWAIEVAG